MIDAVLVTSSSLELAHECIAHLREPEIEKIVLVDNASTDNTVAAVRSAHPEVTVVALEKPTGLAAALNRGAAEGGAPFVLYLNDDVFAVPGSISTLLTALEERPDAVAAGGRLVDENLATQAQYRPHAFPSAAALLARTLGVARLWPHNPLTGGHLRKPLDDHATVEVDQLAGACLLVRRSAVRATGGWDERYWVWYEDVDFSHRLAALGPRLYVPTAPFRHVGGATVRKLSAAKGRRLSAHGILQYSQTHLSPLGRVLVALATVIVDLARAAVSAPTDRAAARLYMDTVRSASALLANRNLPPPG